MLRYHVNAYTAAAAYNYLYVDMLLLPILKPPARSHLAAVRVYDGSTKIIYLNELRPRGLAMPCFPPEAVRRHTCGMPRFWTCHWLPMRMMPAVRCSCSSSLTLSAVIVCGEACTTGGAIVCGAFFPFEADMLHSEFDPITLVSQVLRCKEAYNTLNICQVNICGFSKRVPLRPHRV
jgi:hypothetical protein